MKHQAEQFDMILQPDHAKTRLVLEPETITQAPAPDHSQPDLLTTPRQPAAKNLEQWERRQHGSFRARQARRRLLQRSGHWESHVLSPDPESTHPLPDYP